MLKPFIWFIVLLFYSTFFHIQFLYSQSVSLTYSEQLWLKDHKTIKLAPDPNFQPIEFFDENGIYKGLAADYARLISNKLGLNFQIIKCEDWVEVIQKTESGEVDMLNAVVKTSHREKFLTFTTPYLSIPSVIIVRESSGVNLTLSDLKGKTVSMVAGYGYIDIIRNQNPEIIIELANDISTGLREVSFGKIDAFIGDLATTSYYIEQNKIVNLKIASEIKPSNVSGFAVRSDWPELVSILDKGITAITDKERQTIINKWIHIKYEPTVKLQRRIKIMFSIIGIIITILLASLFLNQQLKRIIDKKTMDLKKEILEHKKVQEILEDRESRLSSLINSIPDLIWIKNPEGVYMGCNKRFEKLVGIPESELIGKTDYDLFPEKLANLFRKYDKITLETGYPSNNEEEITFAEDGHTEYIETIKTPIYDKKNKLTSVLGIARDITERKQAEEERIRLEDALKHSQKLEAIGTLAGGIAHDFNNILSVIIGYTEIAIAESKDQENLIHLQEQVLSAGLRAKELVKQILSFSRKDKSNRQPVDISLVTNNFIKLLRAIIPSSIEIRYNIDPNCGLIMSDVTQIDQVLVNLCTNAADAMEENGGVLTIELSKVNLDYKDLLSEPELLPGDYILLSIRDTGTGISSEIQDQIFNPYFTTKEVGKGSGIGLSIVHNIIKQHGGMIKVKSILGEGTIFEVYFQKKDSLTTSKIENNIDVINNGNEKILLIDDEPLLVNMLKLRLEKLGYNVTGKTDSNEAVELFRNKPDYFDIIITDQTMPMMTGLSLSKEIRSIRPSIPVILISGYSTKINNNIADAEGINAFLMKPVDIKELNHKIRLIFDNKNPE